MEPSNGISSSPKRKTDPAIRRMHTVHIRNAYVCECGKEFRTYNLWAEHRTDVSTIRDHANNGTTKG
jgi:hypothetical protein